MNGLPPNKQYQAIPYLLNGVPNISEIAKLPLPGADKILFYDVSAGTWKHLTPSTNVSITGTNLVVANAPPPDGDKGDITVTSIGTVWTIDNGVVTDAKIATGIDGAKLTNSTVANAKLATGVDAIKIADGTVNNTEFQYINSLTSNAQTQLDGKVSGTPNVKVYRALLTQSGASAPSATVLENSLGGTVVWTRTSAGIYVGTLTAAFTSNKTFMILGTSTTNAGDATQFDVCAIIRTSANALTLTSSTYDAGALARGDTILLNTECQILVYP